VKPVELGELGELGDRGDWKPKTEISFFFFLFSSWQQFLFLLSVRADVRREEGKEGGRGGRGGKKEREGPAANALGLRGCVDLPSR
jgi:hypothetical protein